MKRNLNHCSTGFDQYFIKYFIYPGITDTASKEHTKLKLDVPVGKHKLSFS